MGPKRATSAAAADKVEEPPTKKAKESSSKTDISKMLSFLKYRADASKNKKGEGLEEAKQALAIYQSLDKQGEQKSECLSKFFNMGKNNLKWVYDFKHQAKHEETTEVAAVEDFYLRTTPPPRRPPPRRRPPSQEASLTRGLLPKEASLPRRPPSQAKSSMFPTQFDSIQQETSSSPRRPPTPRNPETQEPNPQDEWVRCRAPDA